MITKTLRSFSALATPPSKEFSADPVPSLVVELLTLSYQVKIRDSPEVIATS